MDRGYTTGSPLCRRLRSERQERMQSSRYCSRSMLPRNEHVYKSIAAWCILVFVSNSAAMSTDSNSTASEEKQKQPMEQQQPQEVANGSSVRNKYIYTKLDFR